jgi:7-dehydrocholesterol reductase
LHVITHFVSHAQIFLFLFSPRVHDEYRQRQEFRATNGKQKVWGKEPDYIVAKYTTKDGEVRSSLLLCSGWWSLAR